jgi:hypothetical protein
VRSGPLGIAAQFTCALAMVEKLASNTGTILAAQYVMLSFMAGGLITMLHDLRAFPA